MRTIEQLQARNIRDAIKHGRSVRILCALYGCTEEELRDRVRQLYNQNDKTADDVWKRLMDIDKRANKKREKADDNPKTDEPNEDATVEDFKSEANEEPIGELEKAHTEADVLSDEVVELENEHRKYEVQRARIKEAIGEINHRLTQLRREVLDVTAQYVEKAREFNQIGEDMLKNSAIRSEKIERLDSLRERIKQLETVQIFVYQNGEIEYEEGLAVSLVDDGYESIYDELISSAEDYLDLKKSQLRTLARVLAIAKNANGQNFEYAFDDDDIELAFEMIRSV